MDERSLQELCYRVIQKLRRYGNGCPVTGFEGRVDPMTNSWQFRSRDENFYSPTVVHMLMSMDEIYSCYRISLPSFVEAMRCQWDPQQQYPSVSFYDGRGREVCVSDRVNYRQQISAMFEQEYLMTPPQISEEPKRYNNLQASVMYGMKVVSMGVDLGREPSKPKEKSRKELLAESRPARLARLWKDMYTRTGKKPLSIKELVKT